MDDLFGKMQSVLSDPESMQQLKELAALIEDNESADDSKRTVRQENSSNDSASDNLGFDIGKLMELSSLMNSTKNDEDAALLLALKPHLKEERQQKVDKAVKMLKMLSIWKTLKDTGILKDFL